MVYFVKFVDKVSNRIHIFMMEMEPLLYIYIVILKKVWIKTIVKTELHYKHKYIFYFSKILESTEKIKILRFNNIEVFVWMSDNYVTPIINRIFLFLNQKEILDFIFTYSDTYN